MHLAVQRHVLAKPYLDTCDPTLPHDPRAHVLACGHATHDAASKRTPSDRPHSIGQFSNLALILDRAEACTVRHAVECTTAYTLKLAACFQSCASLATDWRDITSAHCLRTSIANAPSTAIPKVWK